MKTFKSRIRKYSFWTGLSAALVMLCGAVAKCFGLSIDNKVVEDVVMSICGVLVALGFVCAPKSSKIQKEQNDNKTEDNTDKNK